jgi:hypothetical protein
MVLQVRSAILDGTGCGYGSISAPQLLYKEIGKNPQRFAVDFGFVWRFLRIG